MREFAEAGVAVEFVREHMTFTGKDSPMQQLICHCSAQWPIREGLIRERQREGTELAKKRGVYKGRRTSLTAEQVGGLRGRPPRGDEANWPTSTASTATPCTGTWRLLGNPALTKPTRSMRQPLICAEWVRVRMPFWSITTCTYHQVRRAGTC